MKREVLANNLLSILSTFISQMSAHFSLAFV